MEILIQIKDGRTLEHHLQGSPEEIDIALAAIVATYISDTTKAMFELDSKIKKSRFKKFLMKKFNLHLRRMIRRLEDLDKYAPSTM